MPGFGLGFVTGLRISTVTVQVVMVCNYATILSSRTSPSGLAHRSDVDGQDCSVGLQSSAVFRFQFQRVTIPSVVAQWLRVADVPCKPMSMSIVDLCSKTNGSVLLSVREDEKQGLTGAIFRPLGEMD